MIIRGKIVYVYDIEVFQNIFHCSVKNTETNDIYKFEISERKNQLRDLVKFFKQVDKYITWGDYYTTNINKEVVGVEVASAAIIAVGVVLTIITGGAAAPSIVLVF